MMILRNRPILILALAFTLALSSCDAVPKSEPSITAEDLLGKFGSVSLDFEPTASGEELAEYAELVVSGEIRSFGPVVDEISPPIGADSMVLEQHIVAELSIDEVLEGTAAEETVAVLLPFTPEMQEHFPGTASINTLAYLEPFQPDLEWFAYPQLDDVNLPVFIFSSPQAWIVELTSNESLIPLMDEFVVDAALEDFMPSELEWPYSYEH